MAAPKSLYLAATKLFYLKETENHYFNTLSISAGFGTGRFLGERAVILGKSFGFGPFFSVGLRISRPFSVMTSFSGGNMSVALSIAPFKKTSLVFVTGLNTLFEKPPYTDATVNSKLPFLAVSLGLNLDDVSSYAFSTR